MPTNIKLYDGTTDPKDHLNRFANAPNPGEWPMPIWCRMFQKTLNGSTRGWFKRLPPGSINEWSEPREAFTTRWTIETSFILGVPEVVKISSFIDSLKCPESAKRYSDKVPKIVEEMMVRLDDFVRFEEAFARTELPKGEAFEQSRRTENYVPYRGRDNQAPYPPPRGDYQGRVTSALTLDALAKPLKEILANETQLRLPLPRPMLNPPKNRQLEKALKSGKLNHLVRDVRQRGRGNQMGDAPQQAKIINMIRTRLEKEKKRKARETTEAWMNTPITFLLVSIEDVSKEPLIVEVEVEGYLVR
nr:hypothetical protein [Tanacetum cinerariifolium]